MSFFNDLLIKLGVREAPIPITGAARSGIRLAIVNFEEALQGGGYYRGNVTFAANNLAKELRAASVWNNQPSLAVASQEISAIGESYRGVAGSISTPKLNAARAALGFSVFLAAYLVPEGEGREQVQAASAVPLIPLPYQLQPGNIPLANLENAARRQAQFARQHAAAPVLTPTSGGIPPRPEPVPAAQMARRLRQRYTPNFSRSFSGFTRVQFGNITLEYARGTYFTNTAHVGRIGGSGLAREAQAIAEYFRSQGITRLTYNAAEGDAYTEARIRLFERVIGRHIPIVEGRSALPVPQNTAIPVGPYPVAQFAPPAPPSLAARAGRGALAVGRGGLAVLNFAGPALTTLEVGNETINVGLTASSLLAAREFTDPQRRELALAIAANRANQASPFFSGVFAGAFGNATFRTGIGPNRFPQTVNRADPLESAPPTPPSLVPALAGDREAFVVALRSGLRPGLRRTPGPVPPTSGQSVYSLFANNVPVRLHLLSAEPTSTDPGTWAPLTIDGVNTVDQQAEILGSQGGVQGQFRLEWPEPLDDTDLVHLWGVGVSYQGAGLFAWPVDPDQDPGTLTIDIGLALVL